ncbi:MAG: hypothetical protein WC279_12200 [Sulfurimonas sp.]|jgi:hypothetical protein
MLLSYKLRTLFYVVVGGQVTAVFDKLKGAQKFAESYSLEFQVKAEHIKVEQRRGFFLHKHFSDNYCRSCVSRIYQMTQEYLLERPVWEG